MTSLAEAVNNSGIGNNVGLNKFKDDELLGPKLSLLRLILENKASNEN